MKVLQFESKKIPREYKKITKFIYYVLGISTLLIDKNYKKIINKFHSYDQDERDYILSRVNYYNKVNDKFPETKDFIKIKNFKKIQKNTYFFDLYKYLRYFAGDNSFKFKFGDVNKTFDTPTITKSRPVNNSENSILMSLDSRRHFYFVEDNINFESKKNILVWRGAAYQSHRKKFIRDFYNNNLCDVGVTDKVLENKNYQKEFLTIQEQFKYKFIFSIEGNDVATNLKWAMYSNSLIFMTKPKYETWFMEGALIPDYHYVLIADDYSDLEEKIKFYSDNKNLDKALSIINNAKNYVRQFFNLEREKVVSIMVLDKYFANLLVT